MFHTTKCYVVHASTCNTNRQSSSFTEPQVHISHRDPSIYNTPPSETDSICLHLRHSSFPFAGANQSCQLSKRGAVNAFVITSAGVARLATHHDIKMVLFRCEFTDLISHVYLFSFTDETSPVSYYRTVWLATLIIMGSLRFSRINEVMNIFQGYTRPQKTRHRLGFNDWKRQTDFSLPYTTLVSRQ